MALQPLSGRREPYGVFDALDSQVTSCKGGEVCTFTYVSITGTDKHAKDVDDGYVSTAQQKRPAATTTLANGNRPLFLTDDGISYYGTLFGVVVGASVGQQVTGGTTLGPHSAAGSGKWTLWDEPGIYSVTLDAVDTTALTGLAPTNTSLLGSAALYATTAGLLTPNVGAAFESLVLARFIEFATNGSLVTSPLQMVQSLNSPSGSTSVIRPFDRAVIHWHIET